MAKTQGVTYFTDMTAVATTIGAIESAAQVADTDRYIGKLINAAHAEVAEEFNAHMVARAMGTTLFNHMFEWGTAGMNNGTHGVHLNPMSQAAQLWEHTLTGTGKNKSVGFRFLPSKVPVPLPTTEKTGISPKYLSKLKGKHIFWNKAAIMEAGTPVHIAPKNNGRLFIPLIGMSASGVTEADKARGFIMTPNAVTLTPGAQNAGQFGAYWERYWANEGQDSMDMHMSTALDRHLTRVQKKGELTRGALTPASSEAVPRAIEKGRVMGAKSMIEQATSDEVKKGRK